MERKKKYVVLLAWLGFAACAPGLGAEALPSPEIQPWPLVLRTQMARLENVGYRIGLVAAPLCPSSARGTGLSFDYIESYPTDDRQAIASLLHMTNAPQVAAVAEGSPSEVAGIKVGDDLISIDGKSVEELLADSTDRSLFADELNQYIAGDGTTKPLVLRLRRKEATLVFDILPKKVCAAAFVLKTGIGISAFSDGKNVAISSKLIAFTNNDDELALIAAHEIGHVINQDGKASGLAARRGMEDRADALGIHLMRCAGYNSDVGVNFWLRRDANDWLRMFRDPTHRSRKSRVDLMRREAVGTTCPPTVASVAPPA